MAEPAPAAPPAGTAAPRLQAAGFAGPLDRLLELVQRQRLDLAPLSLPRLLDQFLAGLAAATGRVPLERRGDWLVLASQLVLLKARLLCPATPAVAAAAEAEARQRLGQLAELARMRAAADWLAARPQRGRTVFGRGLAERPPHPQAARHLAWLEATLAMLEGRDGPAPAAATAYRPAPLDLWRVPEALALLRQRLPHHPDGLPLTWCLPPIPPGAGQTLRHRAALASTLLAGLELAREGWLQIDQDQPFGAITLRPG